MFSTCCLKCPGEDLSHLVSPARSTARHPIWHHYLTHTIHTVDSSVFTKCSYNVHLRPQCRLTELAADAFKSSKTIWHVTSQTGRFKFSFHKAASDDFIFWLIISSNSKLIFKAKRLLAFTDLLKKAFQGDRNLRCLLSTSRSHMSPSDDVHKSARTGENWWPSFRQFGVELNLLRRWAG